MSRIDELGGWPAVLTELLERRDLPAAHARTAMATILDGEATAAQLIGFVVALRAKGETPEEISGLLDAVLEAAKKAGAQVSPVKVESPLVRVDFLTGVSKCDDAKVESILPLKENIVALDLGRTIITDAALKTIGQLPRLVTLDLRQTKVGDAGLESLSSLKNLHTLNLYGTLVTDEGLKHLAKIKSLKNIYLWQSKATKAGVKQLAAALPGVKVSIE